MTRNTSVVDKFGFFFVPMRENIHSGELWGTSVKGCEKELIYHCSSCVWVILEEF